MKYTIGFDVGSSSVKIAIVEAHSKKKIAVITEPQEEMPIHAEKLNWAEQDPEMWWSHLCNGIHRILKENSLNPSLIVAVGISYQMHGLVVLDKNKKVLRNSIIWCDSRAVEIGEKAADDIGEELSLIHI